MASQELKQRVRVDDPNDGATTMNDAKKTSSGSRSRRDRRMAMAKRGLRSLVIAVSLPLSLSLFTAYLGSKYTHAPDAVTSGKPFWFPPMWALHLTCPASTLLMSISAWMVWAEGGFHKNPTALLLYMAQLLFTLLWDPIVFAAGATRVGLIVCLGMVGALVGCMRVFGQVNPTAGDLIKPCLAWIAFLSIVNIKLAFL